MTDPLLIGPRTEFSYLELLDSNDEPVGVIPTVSSMRVQANADAAILSTASITFDVGTSFDWHRTRFRPWLFTNGIEWPLGVFMPSSPKHAYSAFGRRSSVTMLDKTSILDRKKSSVMVAFPAGTNAIEAAESLIEEAGGNHIALTPSDSTIRDDIFWDIGTSYLTMVNDLLRSVNYRRVWCDGYGWYRGEPYVDPMTATPTLVFKEDEFTSIHSPDFDREQDIAGVPNEAIAITSASDEIPALVAIARNLDPDSPYSIPRRDGLVVSRTYENVEAADQATLQGLANRYLSAASSPRATVDISHATVPIDLNEVVHFQSADLDGKYVVNEYDIPTTVGGLIKTKLTEVVV